MGKDICGPLIALWYKLAKKCTTFAHPFCNPSQNMPTLFAILHKICPPFLLSLTKYAHPFCNPSQNMPTLSAMQSLTKSAHPFCNAIPHKICPLFLQSLTEIFLTDMCKKELIKMIVLYTAGALEFTDQDSAYGAVAFR